MGVSRLEKLEKQSHRIDFNDKVSLDDITRVICQNGGLTVAQGRPNRYLVCKT